jgi:hypothetical protein
MPETPAEAWRRGRPLIEAALAHGVGGHAIEDVEAGIESGLYHFWPGDRCAVVTEIWRLPRARILNFWLVGGDLKGLLALRPHIEAWARAQGCVRVVGGGPRRGWARVLAPLGYRPEWIVFSKDLSP